MDIKEILAKNVRLYRSRKGYSQDALAEICEQFRYNDGLTNRSFISDVENGKRNVALDKIELLAKALDVEPYELLLTKDMGEKI